MPVIRTRCKVCGDTWCASWMHSFEEQDAADRRERNDKGDDHVRTGDEGSPTRGD